MNLFFALFGCSDVKDAHDHDHDHELITTVLLDFQEETSGDIITAAWTDVELSGSPTADDIVLSIDQRYRVSVSFLNELEQPVEDITPEIDDESDEHQIFFTGDPMGRLVEHSYLDSDANGLPIGLDNDFLPLDIGDGVLTLTLRHLPPESEQVIKVEGLNEIAQTDGLSALPGASDVEVDFLLFVE